jgi:hypothetical protein
MLEKKGSLAKNKPGKRVENDHRMIGGQTEAGSRPRQEETPRRMGGQ